MPLLALAPTGSSFVSCASFTVPAKRPNPALPGDNGCDPLTYTVSARFLAETHQADPAVGTEPATCSVNDEATANTRVSGWAHGRAAGACVRA